jgi:hypothetical protein
VDVYTYTFTASGNSTVLTSEADEKQRKKGTKCDSSDQLASSYVANDNVACWQRASSVLSGESRADIAAFYRCGNGACIKLLNPADEYAAARNSASLFITLGSVFLGVGLSCCGIFGALARHCKRNDK